MRIVKENDHFKLFINKNVLSIYIKAKNIFNMIGTLDYDKLEIITTRNSKKHLFHRYNGYGMNAYVLDHTTVYRYIRITIDVDTYLVPLPYWKANSVLLTIGGYEQQYILPFLLIKDFIIDDTKRDQDPETTEIR